MACEIGFGVAESILGQEGEFRIVFCTTREISYVCQRAFPASLVADDCDKIVIQRQVSIKPFLRQNCARLFFDCYPRYVLGSIAGHQLALWRYIANEYALVEFRNCLSQ